MLFLFAVNFTAACLYVEYLNCFQFIAILHTLQIISFQMNVCSPTFFFQSESQNRYSWIKVINIDLNTYCQIVFWDGGISFQSH